MIHEEEILPRITHILNSFHGVLLSLFFSNCRWERIGKKDGELDVVSGLTLPTLKNGLRLRVEATS